ncbi:hypothetical protein JG687_00017124, partial [Phytophthora cactorum]
MDYATEWGYVELYAASGTGDALTRAIEGYHDDVATYLLEVCRIQWDLKSAYEKAIEGQRPELVERIYPLCSQYVQTERVPNTLRAAQTHKANQTASYDRICNVTGTEAQKTQVLLDHDCSIETSLTTKNTASAFTTKQNSRNIFYFQV